MGRLGGRGWTLLWMLALAFGGVRAETGCYESLGLESPQPRAARVLYVLVDQSTPLGDELKARILALVADWGRRGDRMEVARFSANIRGRYPTLVYAGQVEAEPDEAYLYHLKYNQKSRLLRCLREQPQRVQAGFRKALQAVLDGVDYKIPKTDLFYSLKLLSEQMIQVEEGDRRIVLLVTDGLENSAVSSFYHRKRVRRIDPKRELKKVRAAGLLANWKGARIYVYGLGLEPDAKRYLPPQKALRLKAFWERYFVVGGGEVVALGMPELFVRRLR